MPAKKCLLQKDIDKVKVAVEKNKPFTYEEQRAIEKKASIDRKKFVARSGMSTDTDYYRSGGNWFLKGKQVSGSELERLAKMRIPPAWESVLASVDPKAKVQGVGQASNGKWQSRYSAEHIAQKEIEKFDRSKLFSRDISSIRKNINDGVLQENEKAMLLRLEDKTAIRVGTTSTHKTRKKAYGLTTLKNEHLRIDGEKIFLDFTAKEGIQAHYEVRDNVLASWLKKKKKTELDELFPKTNASSLNNYLKEMAGGTKYTVKDFRTYHGTKMAFNELKKYKGKDLRDKEKKDLVKKVLDKVSSFLRNTPTMAKKSYIDPMVWEVIGGI